MHDCRTILLDAAQVIDLIDGRAKGLREALQGYRCVLPCTLIFDLFRKNDQPPAAYSEALSGLEIVWSIHPEVLCAVEINLGVDLLLNGSTGRCGKHGGFPFRGRLGEAMVELLKRQRPELSPQWLDWLASFNFTDFFGREDSQMVLHHPDTQKAVDRTMQEWGATMADAARAEGLPLREAVVRLIQSTYPRDLSDEMVQVNDLELTRLFPASCLAQALRLTAQQDRKTRWKSNDIADLNNAIVAPYCDVIFCDAKMARRLERAREWARFSTQIVPNGQVRQFLAG